MTQDEFFSTLRSGSVFVAGAATVMGLNAISATDLQTDLDHMINGAKEFMLGPAHSSGLQWRGGERTRLASSPKSSRLRPAARLSCSRVRRPPQLRSQMPSRPFRRSTKSLPRRLWQRQLRAIRSWHREQFHPRNDRSRRRLDRRANRQARSRRTGHPATHRACDRSEAVHRGCRPDFSGSAAYFQRGTTDIPQGARALSESQTATCSGVEGIPDRGTGYSNDDRVACEVVGIRRAQGGSVLRSYEFPFRLRNP